MPIWEENIRTGKYMFVFLSICIRCSPCKVHLLNYRLVWGWVMCLDLIHVCKYIWKEKRNNNIFFFTFYTGIENWKVDFQINISYQNFSIENRMLLQLGCTFGWVCLLLHKLIGKLLMWTKVEWMKNKKKKYVCICNLQKQCWFYKH